MSPIPTSTEANVEYPWTDEQGHEMMSRSSSRSLKVSRHEKSKTLPKAEYKMKIVWRNVLVMAYLHGAAIYGLYLILAGQMKLSSLIFTYIYALCSGFGITAGAHRYWTHKSYKAKTPLRIILAIFQTIALQNSIYEWSRDHRVHHKYAETDADPHNAKRGFFFAHIGWLLVKKHPDVINKGRTVDMSDLDADPIVQFQHKYYVIFAPLMCFVIPMLTCWYFFGESWTVSYHAVAIFRFIFTLNATWCVNSVAHLYGDHPYDKSIKAAENEFVGYVALGEGWHNYHHVFPWDYRTSELSPLKVNFTTNQIDRLAQIGWAYDLKTVPKNLMMQRIARTGDGTYRQPPTNRDESKSGREQGDIHAGSWGWGDPTIPTESIEMTEILYAQKHN